MMSHAVLFVAALLSVATAQTIYDPYSTNYDSYFSSYYPISTTYGTYDPYSTSSSYPYYASSSSSYYAVSDYTGYSGSSYLPYSFPVSSNYYESWNAPDFEIPALFSPPECTVYEELIVTTLSAEEVGRALTYDRELTCDCDTNGNPMADTCVRPDDGYLAGSCYEMIPCDVELAWTVDVVRFTGVDHTNPSYNFEVTKSLGCYCDVMGNPQFEQCVDLEEKQAYEDEIADALADWEAEQAADYLAWEIEQEDLYEEWKIEQQEIEDEWEAQLLAWETEQLELVAEWETDQDQLELDLAEYEDSIYQEYVDNYWAFIATLDLDDDIIASLEVPPMPAYDPYAYSSNLYNPYTTYDPYGR